MRTMGHRNIGAVGMIMAACFIIVLHSVVPHHHHDCWDGGLVFENELECHCDHHDHDCDHHDGCCKLQDLLSQLVISTKDDKWLVINDQWSVISGQWFDITEGTDVPDLPVVGSFSLQPPTLNYAAGYASTATLRGPPVYC